MEDTSRRARCRVEWLSLPELADTLDADKGFVSIATVLEQESHGHGILRTDRQEPVPYSLIGHLCTGL
jgi:hypothetical protein